jgi:hypothetical protein
VTSLGAQLVAEVEVAAPVDDWLFLDWSNLFAYEPAPAIVEGLVFPGRWTHHVAAPKVGKSTLLLHVAHSLARGVDPFDGSSVEPVDVVYVDLEMGRVDALERLRALGLAPGDLARLHYADRVHRKLDTVEGGAALVTAAKEVGASVVVIDGINGGLSGAENDDLPWRNAFDHTVTPLKLAGVAVLSSHNLGKDTSKGGRGSSIQMDKPDAIGELRRTQDGIEIRFGQNRRTIEYPERIPLVVRGVDGSEPITFRRDPLGGWPAGTAAVADLLDELGVALDAGRPTAAAAVKAAGERVTTAVLAAAIRYRRTVRRSPNSALSEGDEQCP